MINLLFSKKCIICKRKGAYICDECKITPIYEKPKSNVFCLYKYDGVLRQRFIGCKFNGQKHYMKAFSKMMAQDIEKFINLNEIDIITYVPISFLRMHKRGFNQAELLCDEICKKAGKKPQVLLRKKESQKQSKLKSKERQSNVLDKFVLKKDIKGKKILIIDDVYTTGASVNEIERTLYLGGADKVFAYILFKT